MVLVQGPSTLKRDFNQINMKNMKKECNSCAVIKFISDMEANFVGKNIKINNASGSFLREVQKR